MAIALQPRQRAATARPPWVRHRASEPEGVLTALMLGLLVIGVAVVVLAAQMLQAPLPRRAGIWRAEPAPVALAESVASQAEATAPPAEGASAAPLVKQGATPPELAVGARARVANTDGLGVVLHAAPRAGARKPAGLLEGTAVTILELADAEWARVQSAARQDGWVPVAYLAPSG